MKNRLALALGLGVVFLAYQAHVNSSYAQLPNLQTQEPGYDASGPKPDTSSLTGLRFLTEGDYPPFDYYDEDGQLTGFNVEIARAICRELEVPCEVTATSWDNIIPALKANEADAAIASIAINEKSLADLDFTDGYYNTPARFAAKTGSGIEGVTPEALEGKTIGVIAGTAHEAYLKDFFSDSEIKSYKTAQEARAALKSGEVELLFGDVVSLMFWVNGQDSEGCCQLLPGGFTEAKYFGQSVGIAVIKGNRDLQDILNYALARVRASGRYEEIFSKYFPSAFY